MKLLIVDDNATNRKLLRVQLETEGHSVLEAANGTEALRLLGSERVDGVVSDILMPEMDGYRLCLEIRRNPRIEALPLILYTSTYNSPADRKLAQSVGADAFITKPSPTPVILEALHAAAQKTLRAPGSLIAPVSEDVVLKQYNEALVRKLEEKNDELQRTLQQLQTANEEVVTLNRDLESRVERRTAELQALNRELESFSYSVSHDLRAPLRAIGGYANILLRDHAAVIPPEAADLMQRISDNARRMDQLINDLLEFSRLGRKELSLQRVNLMHVVRECFDDLRQEQEGRKVTITVGDMPACHGDLILLKQALTNLISNALKYSAKREHARIEVGGEIRKGEYLGYVRDNGVGFDMRYADKLFEVFQRLHGRSEFEGTGVGLAIVKRVFERHGGRVWAEAATDQGATFYFSLPTQDDAT
jgi:two-component system, sensor histidine kinase and response regulator